jgi:hypothetical protein
MLNSSHFGVQAAAPAPPDDRIIEGGKMRKALRISLGIALVILGIIGGLLPVIQGWMFMIPGLLILSEYFPPVRRALDWAKKKAGWSAKTKAGSAEPS